MSITLVVDSGPEKGVAVEFIDSMKQLSCGRVKAMELKLSDPLVSSKHFRILQEDKEYVLVDLNSTNGLFLNGERVDRSPVKPGDVIRAGDTFISVVGDEEPNQSTRKRGMSRNIPGFSLEERIGVGGMGVVYRAIQKSLDRQVALKVLSPKLTKNREVVERFIHEAKAAGKLTHANVVQVHDVGESDGQYFICMEYVGGGSLSDALRAQGRLEAKTVASVAMDIAMGLEYAESQRIIHCDIKPDNIMLTEDGRAKIADLGIARQSAEAQGEQSDEVLGSPHFMAPEQAQGKPVDRRTDLYALGCTMYRAITGRTPFSGASAREIMEHQVYSDPPEIKSLASATPDNLIQIVEKLMEKDPNDRYQSAKEVIDAIKKFSQQPSERTTAKPPPPASGGGVEPTAVATQLRTTNRVRRIRNSSNSTSFLPMALGAVVVCIIVVVIFSKVMPDYGASALRRAEIEYSEGRYTDAKRTLFNKRSSDPKISLRINELRHQCDLALKAQMAEARFAAEWRLYQDAKAGGETNDRLFRMLVGLKRSYGRYDVQKGRLIRSEMAKYPDFDEDDY